MKISTKIALVAALFTMSYSVQAQCTGTVGIYNESSDTWRVSYYNNDIVVPPGSSATLGFINADPNIGRGVILENGISPIFCGHKFQNNPDFWTAPCAPGTTLVRYYGVLDPGTGCYNSGTIKIE